MIDKKIITEREKFNKKDHGKKKMIPPSLPYMTKNHHQQSAKCHHIIADKRVFLI